MTDQMAYMRLLSIDGMSKIKLAKIVGITKQAVTRWDAVPLKYVKTISEATGIPKADLRPSDFA